MKELWLVLRSQKMLLLWVLLAFIIAELQVSEYVMLLASFLLLVLALVANVKLLQYTLGRVFLLVSMFAMYWCFGVNSFPFSAFIQWTVPCCTLFMIGHSVVKNYCKDTDFIGMFLIIALCTGIYNIGVSIGDIFQYGIINYDIVIEDRKMRDEEWRATSLLAAELAPLISCSVLLFVSTKDVRLRALNKFGGIFAIIGIICTLHFVSRSALIITIVSVIIGILYRFFQGQRRSLWLLLVLGVVLFLFFRSGLWKMIELKNEMSDIATGNGRLERMEYWWNQVLKNPFGVKGYEKHWAPWAHNFWIDFAKSAGWIPGICLLIFSILNIKDAFLIYRNKYLSSNVKLLVISMTLAYTLAFSVEPIFGGANHGMLAYILFCGAVSSLARKKTNVNIVIR